MYDTGDNNNVTELFNAELLLPHNTTEVVPTVTTWYDLAITNTSLIWSWLDLDMDWSQVLNWEHHQCHHWQPLQQLYYQVQWKLQDLIILMQMYIIRLPT